MFQRRNAIMVPLVSVAMLAYVSRLHAGPWSSPSGAAADFTYTNGRDLNGRFGDPVVSGNVFEFPSVDFMASATNGAMDTQTDTVSFDVLANPGFYFGLIRLSVAGGYAISGDSSGQSADANFLFSLTENVPPNRQWEQSPTLTPNMPVSEGSGPWSGFATIDLRLSDPVDSMHVEFDGELVTVSGAGGASEIIVGSSGLTIGFTVYPEPTSIGLLAIGSLLLLSRRLRIVNARDQRLHS